MTAIVTNPLDLSHLYPTNYDGLTPRDAVLGGVDLYNKLKHALRYYLIGKMESDPAWKLAYKAFEFVLRRERNPDGSLAMRKNGKDPLLLHAIQQANWIRLYGRLLSDPRTHMIAILLHDELEDDRTLTVQILEEMFGTEIAAIVKRFSKKYCNTVVPEDEYYAAMSACPITSFDKALDNLHNLNTMEGVHSIQKQYELIKRVTDRVLPMLKVARVRFVEQEAAYELIKLQLLTTIQLLNQKLHAQVQKQELEAQLLLVRQQMATAYQELDVLKAHAAPVQE